MLAFHDTNMLNLINMQYLLFLIPIVQKIRPKAHLTSLTHNNVQFNSQLHSKKNRGRLNKITRLVWYGAESNHMHCYNNNYIIFYAIILRLSVFVNSRS